MLEIFAGSAILSSIAKQYGMQGSLAVDKVQKPGARASVIRLDLTREVDCALVDKWLESDMLLWIHLAPVCGTASRARDIQCHPNDPKPLRSCEHPDGLPHLEGSGDRKQTFRICMSYFCQSNSKRHFGYNGESEEFTFLEHYVLPFTLETV